MRDLALLGLRATVGGYVAAHGAQKLFGAFGGPGLDGAAQGFEQMGLTPGRQMAALAGAAEVGGGLLTVAGLGGPIGPIAIGSIMAVAALTAHRGAGLMGAAGGPEQPLTNLAAAGVLATDGFGRLSVDRLFHVRVPRTLVALTLAGAGAMAAYSVSLNRARTRQQEQGDYEILLNSPDAAVGADAAESNISA